MQIVDNWNLQIWYLLILLRMVAFGNIETQILFNFLCVLKCKFMKRKYRLQIIKLHFQSDKILPILTTTPLPYLLYSANLRGKID